MTFSRRPLRRSDVPALARLMAAVNEADEDVVDISETQLLESFDEPGHDHQNGSLAIFDGPALIGYGVLSARSAADPVHNMRHEGAVHPSYRGRGIGAELLAWAEAAAVPLHEKRFPGHPLDLGCGCVSTNEAATALLKGRGYRFVRVFLTMVRDLAEPVGQAPLAEGLRAEELTADRAEDARLVRDEAFRDHWGSVASSDEQWDHLLRSGTFRPRYSFVAYEGSEPLAVVLCHEHPGDLFVGLVGTRAAARGRGLATALLTRAMALAKADGLCSASLNVDADSLTGAVGVYERIGFTTQVSWTVYRKDLLP